MDSFSLDKASQISGISNDLVTLLIMLYFWMVAGIADNQVKWFMRAYSQPDQTWFLGERLAGLLLITPLFGVIVCTSLLVRPYCNTFTQALAVDMITAVGVISSLLIFAYIFSALEWLQNKFINPLFPSLAKANDSTASTSEKTQSYQ